MFYLCALNSYEIITLMEPERPSLREIDEHIAERLEPSEFVLPVVLGGALAVLFAKVTLESIGSGDAPEAVGSGGFGLVFAATAAWNWALMHKARSHS
jgi:hypothetical protein